MSLALISSFSLLQLFHVLVPVPLGGHILPLTIEMAS